MDIIPLDFSTLLIFLFVYLLCYAFLKRSTWSRHQLPGPKGLPFIGRPLFFRSNTKRRPEIIFDASKRYGDVFTCNVMGYNIVYLNGFDNIREFYVKRADEFSHRPSWLPALKEELKEGKGVMLQSGHPWKVMRRFTLQTLRDFGVGKTSIEEKIFQEIDAATKQLEDLKEQPSDVKLLTSMMISNVIYGIVFGKRFSYDDQAFHELLHNLDLRFKGDGLMSIAAILPAFIVRIIDKSALELHRQRMEAVDFLKAHIYNEIKQHDESFEGENIRDFIDLYIETARADKEASKDEFNHGNIFRVIMDLFVAGSETTSNTINWCILYLMEKPDVQSRCYQELQQICGDRPILWEDRGKCPYVEATLLEIQRVANIAPTSVPHTNPEEARVNGYTIPKDSIIIANLYSSHMDPKYWDEPEIFRPERFLGADGKIKKNPAFIPFSTGPRMCMGDSLAKMEMFLIFTNLLQRFKFRRENEHVPHDLQPRLDQVTSAPKTYKVRTVKRD